MTRQKKETGKEVIKASAAIQIEGKITLLQRRAWNVLLANAYDELPDKERHSMLMPDLMRVLAYDSGDQEYLKEALEALVGYRIKWNILDKDGYTEWGVASLLSGAKISRGVCVYDYGSILREKLYNPQMYARLSLLVQNRFESKHALTLWELCVDYLGAKRDYGETPWIDLDTFRKLMGIEDSKYYAAFFKKLKQQVITPATAEINHLSDFRVTVEYQRRGRKITALKFQIRRVDILPEPARTQAHMFPELEDMPPVVKELRDAGLSTQDALEVWQKGFQFVDESVRPAPSGEEDEAAFLRYAREKIHLLKRRQASGKVDHSTGFLREALKKNYANPEFAAEETARAVVVRRQTQQERTARHAKLKERMEDIQRAWNTALGTALLTLADTLPQVVEEAVTRTFAATPFLRSLCPAHGTPLDQYRASYVLRNMVNATLLPYAPEQVAALEAQYAPQIAALKAQMVSL